MSWQLVDIITTVGEYFVWLNPETGENEAGFIYRRPDKPDGSITRGSVHQKQGVAFWAGVKAFLGDRDLVKELASVREIAETIRQTELKISERWKRLRDLAPAMYDVLVVISERNRLDDDIVAKIKEIVAKID